jgi:hypothetical protein
MSLSKEVYWIVFKMYYGRCELSDLNDHTGSRFKGTSYKEAMDVMLGPDPQKIKSKRWEYFVANRAKVIELGLGKDIEE